LAFELSSKKEKKPLYGYSYLIYAGFESDKSLIFSCDKIYNEYKDTFLSKIALYKKFIYYYNEQNDLEKAKEAVDQLNREYSNSLETESAMSHFNDKKSPLVKSSFSDESLNNKSSTLPIKYTLTSNYPNPFNPTTSIEFSLPKNSKADIAIYNFLPAGIHTYFWDGKNENGINMSSGLYILHFSA
jgi:hypothetical protein